MIVLLYNNAFHSSVLYPQQIATHPSCQSYSPPSRQQNILQSDCKLTLSKHAREGTLNTKTAQSLLIAHAHTHYSFLQVLLHHCTSSKFSCIPITPTPPKNFNMLSLLHFLFRRIFCIHLCIIVVIPATNPTSEVLSGELKTTRIALYDSKSSQSPDVAVLSPRFDR